MTSIGNLPLDKLENTLYWGERKSGHFCLRPLTLPSGLRNGTEVLYFILLVLSRENNPNSKAQDSEF